jgi:predicted nucleic acid-binding protein
VIDTNVFLHPHTTDAQSDECQHFLHLVEAGQIQVWLDALVLQELSYALGRLWQGVTRAQLAMYLRQLVRLPGVQVADVDLLLATLDRWGRSDGLGFVDAYLIELAGQRGSMPIYSKNVRALRAQGALVPDPLPAGSD